jgi:hypothetical protein
MKRHKGKAQDMRKACRPDGAFFLAAGSMAVVLPLLAPGQTNGPAMTQVVDTAYRADGTAATGTLLISWPETTPSIWASSRTGWQDHPWREAVPELVGVVEDEVGMRGLPRLRVEGCGSNAVW